LPDKVEVTISPKAFVVAPGDNAEATATLRNLGGRVDQFTISIDGIDASWYSLPVSSVALFPNDQDNLRIVLHPPKTIETEARSYPFRVNVTSQENPDETTTVELGIEIRTLPGLELAISPQRVVGWKGVYQVVITNMSDSEARIHLRGGAAHKRLRYKLRPESLTVPGGGQSEATAEARLGWLARFGGEKQFDFHVLAAPAEAGRFDREAISAGSQLVRIPWHRSLPRIRLRWLARPPVIVDFSATTEDKRVFKLSWSTRRAAEVKLDDEPVDLRGEKLVRPTDSTSYLLTASNKYGSLTQTIEINPLLGPAARVSERIRASLSPSELQVQAGVASAQATLQAQNVGDIVDKFLVEIEGLDETWHSRSASSIALMPQQEAEQVQLSFHPPKRKGVRSGIYSFAVVVRSQSRPEEAASIVGHLEVLPSAEFKVEVRPSRVSCRRKGSYRITLANVGVSDINFTLEATDLDEGCRIHFDREMDGNIWQVFFFHPCGRFHLYQVKLVVVHTSQKICASPDIVKLKSRFVDSRDRNLR